MIDERVNVQRNTGLELPAAEQGGGGFGTGAHELTGSCLHRAAPHPQGPPLWYLILSAGSSASVNCKQVCPHPLFQEAQKINLMGRIAHKFVKNHFWVIVVWLLLMHRGRWYRKN